MQKLDVISHNSTNINNNSGNLADPLMVIILITIIAMV